MKEGETLFRIAQKYDITVTELREWNEISDNAISPGQILFVSAPFSEENGVIHEVEPKETLFSISKQYGVSIAAIKKWNSLSNNALDIGQKLTIYLEDNSQTDLSGTGGQKSLIEDQPTTTNTYYTVKSGDTLYEIARAHNMSVQELKNLNDLSSNTIRIGQRITVKSTTTTPSLSREAEQSSPQGKFIEYQLDTNMELGEILKQFNMAENEFSAMNPDISQQNLQKGQKVTVLAPPSKRYKNPYRVNSNLKNLGETAVTHYDSTNFGNTTTSGELYNPDQLTAAHSNIALGTVIYIQNPDNNRGIYVRVNDRISTNELKLSNAAYEALRLPPDRSDNPSVKIFQDQ